MHNIFSWLVGVLDLIHVGVVGSCVDRLLVVLVVSVLSLLGEWCCHHAHMLLLLLPSLTSLRLWFFTQVRKNGVLKTHWCHRGRILNNLVKLSSNDSRCSELLSRFRSLRIDHPGWIASSVQVILSLFICKNHLTCVFYGLNSALTLVSSAFKLQYLKYLVFLLLTLLLFHLGQHFLLFFSSFLLLYRIILPFYQYGEFLARDMT